MTLHHCWGIFLKLFSSSNHRGSGWYKRRLSLAQNGYLTCLDKCSSPPLCITLFNWDNWDVWFVLWCWAFTLLRFIPSNPPPSAPCMPHFHLYHIPPSLCLHLTKLGTPLIPPTCTDKYSLTHRTPTTNWPVHSESTQWSLSRSLHQTSPRHLLLTFPWIKAALKLCVGVWMYAVCILAVALSLARFIFVLLSGPKDFSMRSRAGGRLVSLMCPWLREATSLFNNW